MWIEVIDNSTSWTVGKRWISNQSISSMIHSDEVLEWESAVHITKSKCATPFSIGLQYLAFWSDLIATRIYIIHASTLLHGKSWFAAFPFPTLHQRTQNEPLCSEKNLTPSKFWTNCDFWLDKGALKLVVNELTEVTSKAKRSVDNFADMIAVHDMFNWLTVLILLPVEVAAGFLYHLTTPMINRLSNAQDTANPQFLKVITEPITKRIIEVVCLSFYLHLLSVASSIIVVLHMQ